MLPPKSRDVAPAPRYRCCLCASSLSYRLLGKSAFRLQTIHHCAYTHKHASGKRKLSNDDPQKFLCGKCGKECGHSAALRSHEQACRRARAAEGPVQGGHALCPSEHNGPFDTGHFMEKALHALGKCRVQGHVPRDTMQGVKHLFQGVLEETKRELRRHLQAGDCAGAEQAMEQVLDAWGKVTKRDAELKHLEGHDAYKKPEARYLGKGPYQQDCYAYDGDVAHQLESMWKHGPSQVWADVKSSLQRWLQKGLRTTGRFDPDWTIEDSSDGYEFGRFIARLALCEGDIPLVFIFYYDGLEVVNGIGQARGTHKLACFYWALVNINQVDRFKHIQLATKWQQRERGVFIEGIQYGEVDPAAFARALAWVDPREGESFVDLGSGTG